MADTLGRADAVIAIDAFLDEREVVGRAHHRSSVAGQGDDRKGAEDRVDRAALEPERAQVRPGQEGAGRLEQVRIDGRAG